VDYNPFLNDLFQQEYLNLFRYTLRLTGDEERSKDLLQDAFSIALSHRDELIRHPAPAGWLKRVVLNLIRNERQKMKNYMEVSMEELPDHFLTQMDHGSLDEILPVTLSNEERNLLIWRFEYQLDYQMIADNLGISPGAARMRVLRALDRCKKALRQDEDT